MDFIEPNTISISELQSAPEDAFKKAKDSKSVIRILNDNNEFAGVLMSKEQHEFACNEIEALYDVIDKLSVSKSLGNADGITYAVEKLESIKLKMMKFEKDHEWD